MLKALGSPVKSSRDSSPPPFASIRKTENRFLLLVVNSPNPCESGDREGAEVSAFKKIGKEKYVRK